MDNETLESSISSDGQINPSSISSPTENNNENGKINAISAFSSGLMNKITGVGDDAKFGISTLVIICLFGVGVHLTLITCIDYWINCCKEPISMLETIKGIWEIITPLLTLTLGYVFGRGK